MSSRDDAVPAVRIPANIELEDRLLAGLTGRQLMILTVGLGTGYALWTVGHLLLPIPVISALVALPVLMSTLVLLPGPDGAGLDRFAFSALRHLMTPRRHVPGPLAPTSNTNPAAKHSGRRRGLAGRQDGLAELPGPIRQALPTGAVQHQDGRWLLLLDTGTPPLSLRSIDEIHTAMAGYRRWLHTLTDPVQLLVRSETLDLTDYLHHQHTIATGLAGLNLRRRALAHHAFLTGLQTTSGCRRRTTLLVTATRGSDPAGLHVQAHRHIDSLTGASVHAELLTGTALLRTLTAVLNTDPSAQQQVLDPAAALDVDPLTTGKVHPATHGSAW